MNPITLRILHLSDLHERGAREGELWRRRRVLGSAWEANLDALCDGGSPQLVCFTGDIADWGQKTEYGQAGEFLHALMAHLGLPMDRLFLVPGNHDIQRKVAEAPWKRLRRNLPQADRQAVSRWLAGGSAPLGFKDRQREQLLERQAAYRRWVADDLGLPHLAGGGGTHPHLGWRHTLHLPGEPGADGAPRPFDLHLIGLDSAWLAGDDSDAGHLRLTDDQVMRQVTDEQGKPLSGLRIALVHHPLDDLADGAECRRLLADHVDLLLRGHLHQSEPNEWADPERRLRQVAAGCIYEGHGADQYPNACTVIEIGVDANGRPQRYQLRFRGWSSRGHWYDDNSLYPGTKDGRLMWWVRSPAIAPDLHPKVERLFVGRAQELQQLEAALLPPRGHSRPVAVCGVQGMPGVGKSYLVDRFFVLHRERFAGGYQRLTLNPDSPLDAGALLDQLTARVELPAGLPDRDAQLAGALARGPTLVHIENVDSEAAAVIAVDLVERLRGAPLALSGRLQGLGQDAGWAQVPLRPFNPVNALEQLRQELGGEAALDDSHRELVDVLGWLPLAIHLAAGHLRPPRGRTVAGFLAKLRSRGLNLAPVDIADHGLRTDRARAILSATFDLSLELLTEHDLTVFGYLGHAPVGGFGDGLGAALAGLDPDEFADLCFEAAGLSLLDAEQSTGGPSGNAQRRWRVHPLLAEYLRQGSDDGAEAISRIGAWFMNRLPEGGDWNAVHAESDALIDWLRRAPAHLWVRIERAGSLYAMRNGPFHAWAAFCETALAGDLEDRERSNMLWTLGNVTQSAGQSDRAMTVAREKADLDRTRGEERGVSLAMGKVADILQARGELDEALRILQKEVLPAFEKLGDVHSRAVTMGKVADILRARGELDEALRILQKEVLPAFEQLGEVFSRAQAVGRMADILQARGELDEALRIRREEQLPVFEKLGDVRSRAVTMGKVADILRARGELDEALRIHREEQLPVYEQLGDVREQAVTMGKVADILRARGELDEALRIRREEELPVYEQLGDVHSRAVTMGKVADILRARGELDEALRIHREEELPVYEQLGDVHSRAVTMGKVADILRARGELDEALRILQKEVLPAFEQLGDVRSRAVTMGKVADILQARGELDEALRIHREEELPVYEQLGDVRERAVTMGQVADILQARGELDEALRIRREEQLPVYEQLGDVRERAVTMGQVADILQARGDLDEALRIRREEELPVYEQLGDVHSRAVTMGKVADILRARGELDEALRIHREEQLPVYEQLGDVRERAMTMGKVADILQARGELDEALRIHREEELPVYEQLGDVHSRAVTMGKVADILQARPECRDAQDAKWDIPV